MYNKSTLANGIRVVTEAIPYVKSVSLGVWVGAGSRDERQEYHGISHFIEHLMFKGTEKNTAKDIAEKVDAIGGQINAFTAKEYTCYYMKVLDSHLEFSFDLLSDMLANSRYDPGDIDREREVVLEEVHMYEDTPDELVHDLHLENVWAGHPLGRSILGEIASIKRFDRSMVTDYYGQFYRPDNLVIAAAGNLKHEQVVDLAERFFGGLSGQCQRAKTSVPEFVPARMCRSKEIEQVHLCLGMPSVRQNAPEIYAVNILNNLLGGSVSSRLFQSIREERGLAYSVYSYQTNYSDVGLFSVYAGTRPGNAQQVLELILQNLREIKQQSITEAELKKAQEQLKGNLLLGLESSSSRMSRLGKMELTLGRYLSLDEVVAKVDAVTIADLQRLMEQTFRSEALSFTALGPVQEGILDAITGI